MIYRLVVMRHAKSSWDTDAPTDHDRPLNPRGQRDAPKIGERLEELGWLPDLVFSSDSTRTRETLALMTEVWSRPPKVEYVADFYHGSLEDIQTALAAVPDEHATVLVLGHNPGWEHACTWFSGEHRTMTTANAALLKIEAASWREAARACGGWKLVEFLRPKELDPV